MGERSIEGVKVVKPVHWRLGHAFKQLILCLAMACGVHAAAITAAWASAACDAVNSGSFNLSSGAIAPAHTALLSNWIVGDKITLTFTNLGPFGIHDDGFYHGPLTASGFGPLQLVQVPAVGNGTASATHTVVSQDLSDGIFLDPENNDSVTATCIPAPPVVSSVSPTLGPEAGGTVVTITGVHFTGATAVSFGAAAATNVSVSDTSITATSPAGSGTVHVTVTTPSATSATSSADQFTYLPPPTVTSVTPNTGPIGGNATVTITGTDFTGATTVKFDGNLATNLNVGSSTSITVTTPAHAVGPVDVAVTTPGGTGTGSGVYTYVPAPTVTSVSPNSGPTAGATSVTITGTNFTDATAVKFDGLGATGVTVVSATSITATTPAHPAGGAVNVAVTTPGGTGTGTGVYTYVPPPTVTSVSPNTGPTAGGNDVTITGTNFTSTSTVAFGATAGTVVVYVNATTITAHAPAGTGTVHVTVTTQGGTSATGASDQYTYVPPPTVTNASPDAGPTAGGVSVTITGTNFTGATAVIFDGLPATLGTVTATTIQVTTPAHAAGAVDVAVTTPYGTGTGTGVYTYVAAPTVTAVSPDFGPTAGSTSVTITGTDLSGATAVTFGATAATIGSVSATSITATSPAHIAGAVDVTVTTAGGTSATSGADQFTYVPPPTVTGVSPNTGPLGGGTTVAITGTDFTGATAVTFGGTAATSVVVGGPTSITATTPAHLAGVVGVAVTTPNGTDTGANLFTYVAAPTVANVSPDAGPLSGGVSVTITGTDFTGATAVTFDGAPATLGTVTATTIEVTTPAHLAGAVDVAVTTPNGTGTGTNVYTYVAAPAVLSVSPNAGPTAGGISVTIAGTDFTGATVVTFDGAQATIGAVNATTITVTTPAHLAGAVDVAVTAPGGTGTGTNLYTYVTGPTVSSVSPDAGPTTGGTTVAITGANFANVSAVKFGANNATAFTFINATTITATAPAGSAGAVDVTVTTPGGTSPNSGSDQFTYVTPPTVVSVSPNAGPTAGGVSVTITGTDFTGVTAVVFDGAAATSFTVLSATSITATTPAHGAGAVDVAVTTPGGTGTGTNVYTYVTAPTVTSVDPNAGPLAGGTLVTLTGTGFTGATAVQFGASSASSFTFVNATTVTATSPAGSSGAVDVTVTTPGGTSATSLADQFTYMPVPTVASVSPDAGPVAGGTSVTITGTGFTGATAVIFDGTAATNVIVVDPTSITATTPAHVAGAVDVAVTTPGGTGTGTGVYSYAEVPTVTSVSPNAGTAAGGTSVTIAGADFTGATAVTFDGIAATIGTVTATTIAATTPAHAEGAVDVAVTTPGGTGTGTGVYTYVAPLSIAPTTLADAFPATPTNQTITVSGGIRPYTTLNVSAFNGGTTGLTAGNLTSDAGAGIVVLSGTPTAPGTASFTVNVTDTANVSLSQAYTLTVQKAGTAVALSVPNDRVHPGQPLDLQIVVSIVPPPASPVPPPSGSVNIKDGSTDLGTLTLTNGQVVFETSTLSIGKHTLSVDYLGSPTHAPSSSSIDVAVDTRVGPEFRVNSTIVHAQEAPSIARLADGGSVIVWQSNLQDGSAWGIYGQRYDAGGTRVGGEFPVNTTRIASQTQPSVASFVRGGFVVSWTTQNPHSLGLGVVAQRFKADGTKLGGQFLVSGATVGESSVISFASGAFLIVWEADRQGGSGFGIRGRVYNAAGVSAGPEIHIGPTYGLGAPRPSVAALAGGGFVAAWGAGSDAWVQRFTSGGSNIGGALRVNGAYRVLVDPVVSALRDGGYVAAWESVGRGGSGVGVIARRFTAVGAPIGAPFIVNTDPIRGQYPIAVAGLRTGGFTVLWSSLEPGAALDVLGQTFDAAGDPSDLEFPVNTTTPKSQWQPTVTSAGPAGFIVAWTSQDQDGSREGIYGQRFDTGP